MRKSPRAFEANSHRLAMILPRSCEVSSGWGRTGKFLVASWAGAVNGIKWRLLLPGASEPRLTELNPSGLQSGFSNCVTQPEQPEHSCRLQLLHSPITAEPYREKASPLRPRRSCFAPARTRNLPGRALVEAPGTAPGSEWFIAAAIYFHSRRTGAFNIVCKT